MRSDAIARCWRSERLRYEPLAEDHAAALVAALDDERVGRFIGGPDVTSVAAARDRIRRVNEGPPPGGPDRLWINHAVLLERPAHAETAGTGPLIGRVEATTYDGWAEVAYVFGPAWWGQGYATEATGWLVDHLCIDHAITEVWAAVHPGNAASMRVLRRLGFERVPAATRDLGSYDKGDVVFCRGAS